MAEEFISKEYQLVSGGTDTHVILIDLTNKKITGKAAEKTLEVAGITINKNMIPYDEKSPFVTSGIRIGTPAVTTRGMQGEDMKKIVSLIDSAISNHDNQQKLLSIKDEVSNLCKSFPLYSELQN
ncbi:MAG: hypothetical protein CMG15_06610 [Candidatus Marinimicrobia bacterium]|nr:hypothetical protein [Candidatus Neomarinimicrobiota bacterium]